VTAEVNSDFRAVLEGRAFAPISGHRALDLLATLRDRHREPIECLREPADLDRWLQTAHLPPSVGATQTGLRDARALRETLNRLVRAVVAGDAPTADDLHELNSWARRLPLAPELDRDLQLTWKAVRPVTAALTTIAREAAELLGGPDRELVRECAAAPSCSRLYLDRSRAHRRRWCHMEWCGSRAKMQTYRRRAKED